MNQTEFARTAGVQKNAQSNYELGERSPTAAYLTAIAAAGVDVLYVLEGTRLREFSGDLSSEELELLKCYREMSQADQSAFRHLANAIKKNKN